jgi:hypothetical protein
VVHRAHLVQPALVALVAPERLFRILLVPLRGLDQVVLGEALEQRAQPVAYLPHHRGGLLANISSEMRLQHG